MFFAKVYGYTAPALLACIALGTDVGSRYHCHKRSLEPELDTRGPIDAKTPLQADDDWT